MLKRLLIIFSLLAGTALAGFIFCWIYLNSPVLPSDSSLVIEKGATLREIAERMEEKGIIRHRFVFMIYAVLTGESHELKAGEYAFENKISPRGVLDHLVKGLTVQYKVPVIAGWTVAQVIHHTGGLEFIKDPDFTAALRQLAADKTFIQSLGIQARSLEGYLFPDTYYFSPKTTPKEFLETAAKAFQDFYQEAVGQLSTPPMLSEHQIVTLASMIEKETGNEEERPIIASVFLNRLKKKMALASDPTVIYGLKNFSGNLTKADLNRPHPYNTYLHAGLPPGPICNPGRASILAALKPAQTDYLYFVSKNDGTHQFSKTVVEHAAAVKKYQPVKSP